MDPTGSGQDKVDFACHICSSISLIVRRGEGRVWSAVLSVFECRRVYIIQTAVAGQLVVAALAAGTCAREWLAAAAR